ncbi:hypothetical protein A2U01_0068085, partial [Trifolium medium]|nr:hypothetical protein [Trifolium medium]
LYTAPGAEDPCAWRILGEFLRIVDPLVRIAALAQFILALGAAC